MLPDTSSMRIRRIGCRAVVELRERLRLALVAHFEVVTREVRDQPARRAAAISPTRALRTE
jgi:hypothetical protein